LNNKTTINAARQAEKQRCMVRSPNKLACGSMKLAGPSVTVNHFQSAVVARVEEKKPGFSETEKPGFFAANDAIIQHAQLIH